MERVSLIEPLKRWKRRFTGPRALAFYSVDHPFDSVPDFAALCAHKIDIGAVFPLFDGALILGRARIRSYQFASRGRFAIQSRRFR